MQLARCRWVLAAALLGCGGAESDGGGQGATASAPARAGDLWEMDRTHDREAAAASLLAFVHGLHVVVVDGDDVYAGSTRRRLTRGADGTRSLALPDSLRATLEPVGEVLELRFSSGERIPMRRRAAGEVASR